MVLVFPDQLNVDSSAFDGSDAAVDVVAVSEGSMMSPVVHKKKAALMIAGLRTLAEKLAQRGFPIEYSPVGPGTPATDSQWVADLVRRLRPRSLVVARPGDFELLTVLREAAGNTGVSLDVRDDRHFFTDDGAFARFAEGRKRLTMEYFYRELRRRFDVLLESGNEPTGGRWNYDDQNRNSFRKGVGPESVPEPLVFPPSVRRAEAEAAVEEHLSENPGAVDTSDQPATPEEAQALLSSFVADRLPLFGRFQDAMWDSQPYLYHSRISWALNSRLLDPRVAIDAAEAAYRADTAPLAAVEGFVRQLLGWREYIRGVYWHLMPEYAGLNELFAELPLPDFYWTGRTEMNCVRIVIEDILATGYAHHIQRLMVLGLYALLAGVTPSAFNRWHRAMYVDAFDWVSLPNVLGMSLYADGGIVATKPYCAGGNYIHRMSNYCGACRYDPAASTGDDACPFTVLYWGFLDRHEERLSNNHRMQLQLKNLRRKSPSERKTIRRLSRRILEHQ